MSDNFKIYGYHITTSPDFRNKENAMTPELKSQLQYLYEMADSGKKSGIEKLLKLIEKYPANPQLKNYLSILYNRLGDNKKTNEINHWIISEHPDYLFGKLNLAAEYYHNKQYEKIPEILGQGMELKLLYPDRDTFHIAEVTGFLKIAILYFCAIKDKENAEVRYNILQELASDSDDAELAKKHIMILRLKMASESYLQEDKTKIKVKSVKTHKTNKTNPPAFTNPEIEMLYSKGLSFEKENLEKILKLPKESLIKDLELVLTDSIDRYQFFTNKVEKDGWVENEINFLLHAFFLLGELKSENSFPCILNVLKQEDEFLEMYFGDALTNCIWEPIYKIANNQLDECKYFMYAPGVYTYAKTEIAKAVEQIVWHQPERKPEVIAWFEDVLTFYLKSDIEDNVIDSDLNGLLICNLIDINAEELIPLIEKLFEKKIVSIGVCGNFSEVKKAFALPENYNHKEKVMSIYERYKHIVTTWAGYKEDDDNDSNYDYPELFPIERKNKIGRNDPCPCGSGKKYKKCCLNK